MNMTRLYRARTAGNAIILTVAVAAALCIPASARAAAQAAMAEDRSPVLPEQSPSRLPCDWPRWPQYSATGQMQGAVTIQVLVDVDGSVAETKLVTSSGYYHLDDATLDGMAKCKFRPATRGGTPVRSWVPLTYTWVVSGAPGSDTLLLPGLVAQARAQAEAGNTPAQFWTAMAYRGGRGVTRDDAEAARWFLKAAGNGHIQAQFHLALMYLSGEGVAKSETEAARWMRDAAEQDHAIAQFNLGAFYIRGQGVGKNATDAERWMRKAAEQGLAAAQVQLGDMYDEGRGVPADGALSAAWYRKAAEQGDVKGQYYLAQCYEYGVGVAPDLKAASAWYAKAAKQGHRESAAALARLKAAG